MVASFSLEAGDAVVEMVTEGLLRLGAAPDARFDQPDGRAAAPKDAHRRRFPVPGATGAATPSAAADVRSVSADDVDLIADRKVVPDGDRVGRPHADAA